MTDMTFECPPLLATYWTIAGIRPLTTDEARPWSFEERARVAAEAGFAGFGFGRADLVRTKERLGYKEIARVLEAHGLVSIEFDTLYDWWTRDERRPASDHAKAEFLQAMEEIAAPDSCMKCAPDLTGGSQTHEAYAAGVAAVAEE